VLELELQLAGVGTQQQMRQSTGKGRAVALYLVAGCSVASLQRCRCLGALTWGSLVYKRCRSGTPGTFLGGVYHSFIHVTPVAEAHLSNASPFQTPLITPNNKLIKSTNKDNFLPG
jgi:hypothetical protein